YVFIEMTINNETYWLVRNTTGVTGFLGGVKPIPMAEDEVANLINAVVNPDGAKPRPAILFEKEENVRITEGPFKHFIGVVEEINQEKGKLKVMVTIFGRPTPVELDFLQVEKI
ncbi:MAG: transcription termination/antitermination NusG family protein, partial [Endomicrobiaceae bacterium]